MADIQSKILGKYGIDINQVNILKLYKIDSVDIPTEELEKKILECRKKWAQSINGANEKFAERDRAYLEKADSFEKILRDNKLCKELFMFYSKSLDSGNGIDFAREYFSVIGMTKKVKKKDVDFFFDYYPEERKKKKEIYEMLNKEFKIFVLGKANTVETEESEVEGKKKKEDSILIVNLFQKATILKLRKCEEFYKKASETEALRKKYPTLRESLYEFLGL